ncbi:MAG: hypothetical protein IPH83_17790 [Gammaproteobacteria bacterium]|nr:hypothetical protein [Gammaproteobacteria bacterium]
MGARIGRPGRPVFCVVGTGLGHVWSELETTVRHGIKVVVAVMNTTVLGYQKHAEDAGVGTSYQRLRFRAGRSCGHCRGLRAEGHTRHRAGILPQR